MTITSFAASGQQHKRAAQLVIALLLIAAAAGTGLWFAHEPADGDSRLGQRSEPAGLPPTSLAPDSTRKFGPPPIQQPSQTEAPFRQSFARLRLRGVVVAEDSGGMGRKARSGFALIAIENENARMVKTGTLLEPGLVLAEVEARSAMLVRTDTGERIVLELSDEQSTAPTNPSPAMQRQAPPPQPSTPKAPPALGTPGILSPV